MTEVFVVLVKGKGIKITEGFNEEWAAKAYRRSMKQDYKSQGIKVKARMKRVTFGRKKK